MSVEMIVTEVGAALVVGYSMWRYINSPPTPNDPQYEPGYLAAQQTQAATQVVPEQTLGGHTVVPEHTVVPSEV